MMRGGGEAAVLSRDCEAIEVPGGGRTVLPKGTRVTITQSLGGNFTVVSEYGAMASIADKDADALGKQAPPLPEAAPDAPIEDQVRAQLRRCYDPEIPHSIVDLGLVYEVRVLPPQDGGRRVEIKMGLTAPGCGMGEWLKSDVRNKVSMVPGITGVSVELVLDPPWTPKMMSEELRLYLNM